MAAVLTLLTSGGTAYGDAQWRNTVLLLADNDHFRPGPQRNWQDLDQQEKQRIYRRHKQFQGWSIEEQQRACEDYRQQNGGRIPKACKKFY